MAWDILDWVMEHIIGWVIVVGIIVVVPLIAYACWQDSNSPKMELTKDEWVCMQHETIPMTTYVMTGKVMVPITTYADRCNQWNRK